jgi:hypothetical protein
MICDPKRKEISSLETKELSLKKTQVTEEYTSGYFYPK